MSKRQYEVAFALAGKLAPSFRNSLTSASGALDALGGKIKALDKARVDVDRWRALKTGIRDTERQMAEAQARVNALAAALRGAEKPTAAMRREFEQAKKQAQGVAGKLEAQRLELNQLRGSLKSAGISTTDLVGRQKALADAAARARAAQEKLQGVLAKQASVTAKRADMRGQMFDAAALAVSVAAPIRSAMQFESAMADVRKVVDFETPQQFRQMGDDILRMGRVLPMAHDGLAAIVAAGGQAGVARGELLKFTEDAAKMGVAFDIAADEAGQMMAGWRSAFGFGQDQVRELADKINYLGNTTAASAPKISDIVTRIGALGDVAGMDSGSIAALGATLAGMNIPSEVAATGIQNLMLSLTAGTAATDRQRGAFEALGLDAEELARRMQENAPAAIADVMRRIRALDEAARPSMLTDIFGKESVKAIAPVLTRLEVLEENLKKVGDSTLYAGSMQKEYEARAATTANAMQLAANAAREFGVRIGSVLLPPLAKLAQAAAVMAGWAADLAEKFPLLTSVLVGGTAALIGLKVAAIAGGYAFTFLQGGLLLVQKAALIVRGGIVAATVATNGAAVASKAWAAAQWLVNAAITANPIGLVIAGVAALAGGAYLLIKHWEAVKEFFGGLFGWMADSFGKIGGLAAKVAGFFGYSPGGDAPPAAKIPAHGRGGTFSAPHVAVVGDRPETIVPHDRNANSLGLWAQAGRALGVGGGGGGVSVSYSPQITITGNADAATVRQALEQSEDRLRAMLARVLHDNRRLALA